MIHSKNTIGKKIILALMMCMLFLFSGVLFACQKQSDKLSISVDKTSAVIFLGETPDDKQTFVATVSNVSETLAKNIHVSSDNTKTSIEEVTYLGNGKSQITIKGLVAGDSIITVHSKENINKKVTVAVKNIQPVQALIEKQQLTKNYVVRGGRTLIDISKLIEFYPSTTEQKNVSITLNSSSEQNRIRIENNYLIVEADTPRNVTSVLVSVESTDRNINPLLIAFDILEPFSQNNILLSSITNFKNLMPSENNLNPIIYLAHNEELYSTDVIRIEVPVSSRAIKIEPVVTNPLLAKITQTKTSSANGYQILDVYLQAGQSIGSDAYLYFNLSYEDYDYVFSTKNFQTKIYSFDIITDIYVNNNLAGESVSYDLFTNYASELNGLEFSFEAFPTTVANEYKSFYVSSSYYSTTNPSQNVIELFTYNPDGSLKPLTEMDEEGRFVITHGQKIVVRAISGLGQKTASILVESVYTADFYEGTERTKQVIIDFDIHEGVNDVSFYGMENPAKPIIYLDNSYQMLQTVYFVVRPHNADVQSTVEFETSGNFTLVNNSLVEAPIYDEKNSSDELVGKAYQIQIKANGDNKQNSGMLKINFGNGRYISTEVKTVIPFVAEDLEISTSSPSQNSAVGFYESPFSYGDFKVAVAVGSSIKFNIGSNGSNFNASYQYYSLTPTEEHYDEFETLDVATLSFGQTSNIISSTNLSAFALISGNLVGKTLVRVTFVGKNLVQTGIYKVLEESPQTEVRYFYVEVYNPIKSYQTNKSTITLYSYESVGFYNSAFATDTIKILINDKTIAATYSDIAYQDSNLGIYSQNNPNGRIEVEQVNGTTNEYRVFARTTDTPNTPSVDIITGQLIFSTVEFGKTYRSIVQVTIIRAKSVMGIVLNNVNEETGIYMDASSLSSTIIDATVSNNDAFNKKMKFFFEPDIGVSSSILTVNEDSGLIRVANIGQGGTGYIVVAPQDVFISKDGQVVIEDANNVVKRIKIVVADGRTRETSYQIASLDKMTDFSAHYTLMDNVVVPANWATVNNAIWTGEFTGGLYGKALYSEVVQTITNNVGALFNKIGQGGRVEDLVLVGSISSSARGFVANENSGIIRNVTVDTYLINQTYSASTLKNTSGDDYVGGLVGTNNSSGLIDNSSFFGKVEGQKFVGGLVGSSLGTITNSKVELYTYENSVYGEIKSSGTISSFAGGLVGSMSGTSARIYDSYVYSYHNQSSISANQNTGAIVGFGSNQGIISRVFARSSSNRMIGNSELTNETQSISGLFNAYYYYYNATDTQTPDTLKIVAPNSQIIHNPLSIFQNFASFYSGYGMTFLTSTPWAISSSKNNGYPYLRSILQETAPSNLSNVSMKNLSNVLVDNVNNTAVFLLFEKALNITTTAEENAVIKNWNTISFQKLFNLANTNGLRVTASLSQGQTKLFDITSKSIIVNAVGNDITLTIFSKYDYSIKKTYTVSVYHAINNFAFLYHGEELDNSAIVNIKKGSSDVFIASFQTSKVAINRKIELKQGNFSIQFTNPQYVIASSNVVFSINTSNFQNKTEWFTVSPYDSSRDSNNYVNTLFTNAFSKTFGVSTYQGASSIDTSVSEIIRMMSSDSISFTVEMITDDVDIAQNDFEKLNLFVTDTLGNSFSSSLNEKFNYVFENGVRQVGNMIYYDGQDMATLTNYTYLGNGFYQLTYKVRLNIAREFADYDFNGLELFIRIESENSSAIKKEIKVILESQSINSIFVTSHESHKTAPWLSGVAGGYAFETEPNNVISPGQSALLNVSLFPEFASYKYIEITSSVVNGNSVIMNLMKVNELNADRYIRLSTGFTAIPNGIRISKEQTQTLYGQSNLAKFFVLITIPSTVQFDTVFQMTIRAFNSNGEEVKSTEFNLITRPLIAAELKVDGQDQLIMARGTAKEVIVTVQLDQELAAATITAEKNNEGNGEVYGVNLSSPQESIDTQRNVKKYTFQLFVSETAKLINSPTPSFFVNAVVRRKIGGVFEEKTTSVKVTMVDFLISNAIKVQTDSPYEDVIETYVGLSEFVAFNFETTKWQRYGATDPELNEAIDVLEAKVSSFLSHNYFYNQDPESSDSKYILNYHEGDTPLPKYKNFLNNLYFVNSDGSTVKVLSENGNLMSNDIITFEYSGNGISSTVESGKTLKVVGLRTGSVKLRLVFSILTPLGTKMEFTYDFTVRVSVYTDEDKPIQISSTAEFLDIQNQTEMQDYILMSDIELTNYTAFDTSKIRSLDGNNKVITIRSFNLANEQQATSISLALFTSVASNSTLKNITVNYYHLSNLVINTAVYKTINFAGFAITNNGIITNCHVLAFSTNNNLPVPSGSVGVILNYSTGSISSGISSTISGFVINNNGSGTITNSRVGGTTFEIVNGVKIQTGVHRLGLFTISGQGNLAGFVYSNSGFISSSFTNNIAITNNTLVGKETLTAGFAGFNSGSISLSYSKGAYSTVNQNEIRTTGSGIATSSVAAGFIYENSGYISDSYSNIMIKDTAGVSGRYGAGFVYKNKGTIEKAYSSSVIENSKTTQMNFNGVDDYGNLLTTGGTVVNSYYYSPSDSSSGDMENKYSSGVLRIESFTNSEVFYGFSFANINSLDGVWVMTSSKGPDLISANEIAISSRYVEPQGDGTFLMPYLSGYGYGTDKNPIIIRTAQEFNNVFGNSQATEIRKRFDLERKAVFGNYRIVSNIDFSSLASNETGDYKLISSEMKLTSSAIVDGNGLTLSNLELVSSVSNQNKYYGLFASLEEYSIVKNLNIKLIGVSASNIQHVGTVAGAIENSKIVNVNISSQSSSATALVLGQNIVGGVVGLVIGDSSLISLSTNNISVTADFFNQANISRQIYIRKELKNHNNTAISYAGGIVGILDLYTTEFFSSVDYSQDKLLSFAQASALKVSGQTQVKGGTVGGVVGYLGINTSLRDADFEITQTNGLYNQKIISYQYAAGGIIGESYGDVTQSKIEHSHLAQMEIESKLNAYYTTNTTVSRGHESLFTSDGTYSPLFVGGLIGQVLSGKISNSYAKVNVIAYNSKSSHPLFVGGIVGGIGDYQYSSSDTRKIGIVKIEEVYAFGAIRILNAANANSAAGGIVGFIQFVLEGTMNSSNVEVSITFDGVNAVTYFDKSYLSGEMDSSSTASNIVMKYIYDFYGYTRKNNTFISSVDVQDKFFSLTREQVSDTNTTEPLNYVMSDLVLTDVTYAPKRSSYVLTISPLQTITFSNQIVSLKNILNVAQDSSYMDIAFRNNGWDEEKWERKDGELLPSIVFTVSTSIFYIRVAEDFNKMADHPDKTFIIIGSGVNGNNRVLIDMSSLNDSNLKTISNFRGVLKGYMPNTDNGSSSRVQPLFGFKNLNNVTHALIESAINGAIFADFIIESSGNPDKYLTDGSILVANASGVVFRNIILNNIVMKSNHNNVGILAGISNNSLFDTIDVIHNLSREVVTLNVTKKDKVTNYSVGLLAGTVESIRRTTFKEITIQINSSTSARNYGIYATSDTLNDSVLRTVNMGGYYGTAKGEVNISSTLSTYFIRNLGMTFSGYSSTKDYFAVNAGAIGGSSANAVIDLNYDMTKNALVSFNLSGQFKSASATSSAVAVGGLLGKTTGFQIFGHDSLKNSVVPKINITNAYEVTQDEIVNSTYPSLYVGGMVGHSSGIAKIKNMNLQSKLESNKLAEVQSNVNIVALNNQVYASGLIAFASGQVSIANSFVNSAFFAKVNSGLNNTTDSSIKNYFGDAVAYFSDSSNSSSIAVNNSYFFARFETYNTSNISYGGVIGATSRIGSTQTQANEIKDNVIGGTLQASRVEDFAIIAGGIVGNSNEYKGSFAKALNISQNILFGEINLVAKNRSEEEMIFMGGIAGMGDEKLTMQNNIVLTTLFANRTTFEHHNYQVNAMVGNEIYDNTTNAMNTNFYSSQINLATEENAQNLSYEAILNKITTIPTIVTKQFSTFTTTNGVVDENGSVLAPYKLASASDFAAKLTNPTDAKYNGNIYFKNYYRLTSEIYYNLNPISLSGANGKLNKALIGDGKTITLTSSQYRLFDVIDSQSFVSGLSLKVSTPNFALLSSTALYPTSFDGNQFQDKVEGYNVVTYSDYKMYAPLAAVNKGVIFGSGVTGLNNASGYEVINENAKKLFAKFILNETNLAGGLVALNIGYIADSFTSVDITNITGKLTNKPLSITGGFVGINQGDIASSYSSGVVNALYGKAYSFGSDEISKVFTQGNNIELGNAPSVRNSFATAQASKAWEEVDETGLQITSHSGVFGAYADNTNFYDVFATQSASKEGSAVTFITKQISKFAVEDEMTNWQIGLDYTNFEYSITNNFGYPSFGKAYLGEVFNFMRQATSNTTNHIIPSLGKLQQMSRINATKIGPSYNLYFVNDMKVTQDMGFVSDRIMSHTSANLDKIGTWDSFSILKLIIQGNDYSISNFVVITNSLPFDVNVDVTDNENKQISNSKQNNGFFTSMTNSEINNLILADGQITLEKSVLAQGVSQNSLGAFAGITTNSTINNSMNLGVTVKSNEFGYVGGIVGFASANTSVTNTINTGNVLSIWKDKTNAPALENYNIFAGGVAGYFESSTFINNQNYGLVMAEQIQNSINKNAIATGISYSPNNFPIQVTEQDNKNNANFGEVRVQENTYKDGVETFKKLYTTNQAYSLFNMSTPSNFALPQNNDNTTMLPSVGTNPTLVYNSADLLSLAVNPTLNFIIMKNISVGQLKMLSFAEELSGKIYGNEKLISYFGYLKTNSSDETTANDRSFINKVLSSGAIADLRILGVSQNALHNVSILANENDGNIEKVNTYGAITNGTKLINQAETMLVAGLVVSNNGTIVSSSNYTLIKGTDGTSSSNQGSEGYSANNIGGIAGITTSNILSSSNFGALIGGNGGNGYIGVAGDSGTSSSRNGAKGGDGTHAGNASVIGGLAAFANNEEQEDEFLVTGNNFGILFAGKGGNGGKGGKGGDGYNAGLARSFSINDIMEAGVAGNGGGGGAGGNGGSTIVGNLVGLTDLDSETIQSTQNQHQSIIYNNQIGLGGNGGQGGSGGAGSFWWDLSTWDGWGDLFTGAIFNSYATIEDYVYHGSGGGGGGSGYPGNTQEAIYNLSHSNKIVASAGETITTTQIRAYFAKGGTGYQKGKQATLPYIIQTPITWQYNIVTDKFELAQGSQQLFNAKSSGGLGGFGGPTSGTVNQTTAYTSEKIGSQQFNMKSVYNEELQMEVYEIYDFASFYQALTFGDDQYAYLLTDDITIDASTYTPIKHFSGNLIGNGKSINIQGSASDFNLFETVTKTLSSNKTVSSRIENVNIVMNITDYDYKFNIYDIFYFETEANDSITFDDVVITGFVYTLEEKDDYQFSKGIPVLTINPSDDINASNFFVSYKSSGFIGEGTESIPYRIYKENWNYFTSKINKKPYNEKHYILMENIEIEVPENSAYQIIGIFRGNFDGNGRRISFPGQNSYESFINDNSGTVKDLTIYGTLQRAPFLLNNGTISNVTISNNSSIGSEYNFAAGFAIYNNGRIEDVYNHASVFSGSGYTAYSGSAAGITIFNYGTIDNAKNYGSVFSAYGHAAGISIYNSSNENEGIFTSSNFGSIKAGNGDSDSTVGKSAAGIVVYNYYNSQNGYIFNALNMGDIYGGNSYKNLNDEYVSNGGNVGAIIAFDYGTYDGLLVEQGELVPGNGLENGSIFYIVIPEE